MDDFLLTLVQGGGPGFVILLFVLFALVVAGGAVHALVTGRVGSGDERILRDEQPRRFRRSLLAAAAFALILLALAAFASARPEQFRLWIVPAMPLIWLFLLVQALRRGVALSWRRDEQPRSYWAGVAIFALVFLMSAHAAVLEFARLG